MGIVRVRVFSGVIAGGGGAPAPTFPETQTLAFGEKTRRGMGQSKLGYTGALPLSITSGNTGSVFAINANNELVIGGTLNAAPPALAGPYTLTVTDGNLVSVVTVNIIPNAFTIAPDSVSVNQITSLLALSAQISYGDTIYLRSGQYGTAQPRKAANFIVRSGGPSAPVNRDDPGWVRVTSEVPYGAVVGGWVLDQQLVKNQYLDFDQIDFYRPALVADNIGSSTFAFQTRTSFDVAMLKVRRCRFRSALVPGKTAVGQGGTDNNYSGFRYGISTAFPTAGSKLWLYDNDFTDLNYGALLSGTDFIVENNRFARVWVDCIAGALFASAPGEARVQDNLLIDKLYGDGGYHGDFIQSSYSGTPAGTYFGPQYYRNTVVRGVGRVGFADGQGIFMSNLPAGVEFTGIVLQHNVISCSFQRAITAFGTDTIVQNNTIFTDQVGTAFNAANAAISIIAGTRGLIKDNIVHTPSDGLNGAGGGGTAAYFEIPRGGAGTLAGNEFVAPAAYSVVMQGPVFGPAASSKAAVLAGARAVEGGRASRDGGVRYAGAINPDGSYATIA